ncbi:MAG: DNA cytosine methyltransferase, partial [Bacteroidales bacterium]
CQDASVAKQQGGGQKGLDGARTGLWRHMVRAIYEIRPRYVIAENVANLLKVNGGRDFAIILYSLTSMGYDVEWRVCNGYEVGLCNQRKRVWIVAHSKSERPQQSEHKSMFRYVLKKDGDKG